MGKREKLLQKILTGRSDNSIRFDDLCSLLNQLGFELRIKGSHHIFYKNNIDEILNLQAKNGYSKPYQVKQVREIILTYKLEIPKKNEA